MGVTFYAWLVSQRDRVDNTGVYAVIVTSDPAYPQTIQRLYAVLNYHVDDPVARRLARFAHREWRAYKRAHV